MDKSKKVRLWLMCGIPGSGKSTWIQKHLHTFSGYTKVVSRDAIRFSLLSEDDEYFAKENKVFKKFIAEIIDGLKNCENTIADATHLNSSSRGKLLRNLKEHLKDVEINAIVINTCLEVCLKRNNKRTGRKRVPEAALRNMFNSFSIPTLEEGFDHIYIYTNKNGKTNYKIIERS